jgi:hypothetical protein
MAEPFEKFAVMLRGGFEIWISHPEAISQSPAVDYIVVYENTGSACLFHVDSIVGLRRNGGFA